MRNCRAGGADEEARDGRKNGGSARVSAHVGASNRTAIRALPSGGGLRRRGGARGAAGYRQLSFDTDTSPRQKFKGLEWLHFELGADYYVFSGLGLGPYAALSLSSYTTRPSSAGDVAVNTELSTGLRFLFDLPGR